VKRGALVDGEVREERRHDLALLAQLGRRHI
jgi:hypothetical protein